MMADFYNRTIGSFEPDNCLSLNLNTSIKDRLATVDTLVLVPDGLAWGDLRIGRIGSFIERQKAELIFNALQVEGIEEKLQKGFVDRRIPLDVLHFLEKKFKISPQDHVKVRELTSIMLMQAAFPESPPDFQTLLNDYQVEYFSHDKIEYHLKPYPEFVAEEGKLFHRFLRIQGFTEDDRKQVMRGFSFVAHAFQGKNGQGEKRRLGQYALAHQIDVTKMVIEFGFKNLDRFVMPALFHDIGEDTFVWNNGKPFFGTAHEAKGRLRDFLSKHIKEVDTVIAITKPYIDNQSVADKKEQEKLYLEHLSSDSCPFGALIIKLCDRLFNLVDFSGAEQNRLIGQAVETDVLINMLYPFVKDSPGALEIVKFISTIALPGVEVLWEEKIGKRDIRKPPSL